jgi:class 3 adenylate cyclase/HEAT repeat protein
MKGLSFSMDVQTKPGNTPKRRSAESVDSFSEEGSITVHRIIETFSKNPSHRKLIYNDLFDYRQNVVLSALNTLGRLRDVESIAYINRLLSHSEPHIRTAAVRTISEIGYKPHFKTLTEYAKHVGDSGLMLEVLKSLAILASDEPSVASLFSDYITSKDASREGRAYATGYMLCRGTLTDHENIDAILKECHSNEKIFEELLAGTAGNAGAREKVIQQAIKLRRNLSAQNKAALLSDLDNFHTSENVDFLFEALTDKNPEIRIAAYRRIGEENCTISSFGPLMEFLLQHVDANPTVEDEALSALRRIESNPNAGNMEKSAKVEKQITKTISGLFADLKYPGRQIFSDKHELGWLIVRSREYMQFYGDDNFKSAVVEYLRGNTSHKKEKLLHELKSTAVKVETKHFEGYNALVAIIKDPDRSGVSLIARELALVETGKKECMYKLIRNLYASRLFDLKGIDELLCEILLWAEKARLYRVAEAAMYALEKFDPQKAMEFCLKYLSAPIESKILTIASIRMITDLNWDLVEPKIINLISQTPDPYILLNLIDALSASSHKTSVELIIVLLGRLVFEKDQELLFKLSGLLSTRADYDILDGLIKMYDYAEESKKPIILHLIASLPFNKEFAENIGLIEFLYKILQKESNNNKFQAATLLYKFGDSYAVNALLELFKSATIEQKTEIIRNLNGCLRKDLFEHLVGYLREESGILHEALRETILTLENKKDQTALVDAILQEGKENLKKLESLSHSPATNQKTVIKEKENYIFQQEHMESCAVFFSDMQGFSKQASLFSPRELTQFLQEYESILTSIVSTHSGKIVKKMGDGQLITFTSALNAVLSGIRLQKAIKRFNIYRDEKHRISLRIGIHWGDVIVNDGDVLGNTVNIASRLEKSSRGGSIYVSEAVQKKIKSYIHSREVGKIRFKGIEKPMRIFEPYEINIALPREKDPASTRMVQVAGNGGSSEPAIGPFCNECGKKMSTNQGEHYSRFFNEVKQSFESMNRLLLKVEKGSSPVQAIRSEMLAHWKKLSKFNTDVSNT